MSSMTPTSINFTTREIPFETLTVARSRMVNTSPALRQGPGATFL